MPLDLTGIQNVGEFYSYHYLDALLENDLKGLFVRWREDDERTPDKRLNLCAREFFEAKSRAVRDSTPEARYPASHGLHVKLTEALGYDYHFTLRYISEKQAVPVLSAVTRDGHDYVWLVETPFTVAEEAPLEQFPFRAQYPKAEEEYVVPALMWEALLSEIFHADEPPRWVILFAGRFIYLVDRTKWGRGQYLLFDLDEIFGRRQAQTLRAAAALLAREALCPHEGVPLHDTLDESSHKHAYGVSSDLKYGLRRAVESLANEYVWYQRNLGKQALFQDDALARKLTDEALTYLYRLLFLFYAEARGGELDVVPMKSDAYRQGYSLESLRDLEQVPLTTPKAQNGYFLHESLTQLFGLVNEGYAPQQLVLGEEQGGEVYHDYGFSLPGLHSPLFSAESTPLLSKAKFRNNVVQEVMQLLSLSRLGRGHKATRGRISYAQLGINQLGAVYEGLLSYTGFFAQETLYEVKPADAKDVDETAQTYFVPESEIGRYEPEEFVYVDAANGGPDGTRIRKTYSKGSFIFRLAGRDREKSASYYTPEVLTRCVVKYSLKELLKEKTADDILRLTMCEPAMGSGAFINEALNQLADAYLERKQKELGQQIPPDAYREERQKVKAYLAVNNAYGVDLNPTAVELARVSFWLNIIYRGSHAPWFGARLAVGNSLIGARREVYSADDVLSGAYKEKAPTSLRRGEGGRLKTVDGGTISASRLSSSVFHWLLPDSGMAAFDSDKVIKELAPDEVRAIKAWRKGFTAKITAAELTQMHALSARADVLWAAHLRERQTMLERTREHIPLWGQPQSAIDNEQSAIDIATKQQEFDFLLRPTSPYRRLKLALDYWCALWFWPIPKAAQLPTRAQFLSDVAEIFASADFEFDKQLEQIELFAEAATPKQTHFADLRPTDVDDLCLRNLRLKLAAELADRQHFHHWELAFPEVLIHGGGFDLIAGNPPWVRPRWNEIMVLSDFAPWISIRDVSASTVMRIRQDILGNFGNRSVYFAEFESLAGLNEYLSSLANFELLSGIQANLYKCFFAKSFEVTSQNGVIGFVHDVGLYDDPKGGKLREVMFLSQIAHFRFYNQLNLFPEEALGHAGSYGVSILLGSQNSHVGFDLIVNLFHPRTIDDCYAHDGFGVVPGMKDEMEQWDLRGHKRRLIRVDDGVLKVWASALEGENQNPRQSKLALIHSQEVLTTLAKISEQPRKLGDLHDHFYATVMFDETYAQRDGFIKRDVSYPNSLAEFVISGPHFYVGCPLNKEPRENCSSKGDYDQLDLTQISDDFLPRVIYKPTSRATSKIPFWRNQSVVASFRHLHRSGGQPTNERTLIAAIAPPGVTHINSVMSITFDEAKLMVEFNGLCTSLPYDFLVRVTGKTLIQANVFGILPLPEVDLGSLLMRTLRLNCVTVYYTKLWEELYDPTFKSDGWAKQDPRLKSWHDLTPKWQRHVALRTCFERRQALVEIDVLAAMALNLTLDELLTIYRVQFPVLQMNERRLRFDQRGMEVPMKTISGELRLDSSHPKFAEMVPPFTPVDREADYREAWGWFEKKMKEE